MADIFISYSRRDADFFRRLHSALAEGGRDVWVDWEDIPFTADWWDEIKTGIGCQSFVFILTPDAMLSPVCQMEIAYAIASRKRLVPVMRASVDEAHSLAALAGLTLNDNTRQRLAGRDLVALARENWHAISSHNWLYFRDEDDFERSFRSLIDAVDTDLPHVKMHTRLLVRAGEWHRQGRDPGYLLHGADLEGAERWLQGAAGKTPTPVNLHHHYLGASRQAENARQAHELALARRAQRRLALLVGGLALVLVGILIGSVLVADMLRSTVLNTTRTTLTTYLQAAAEEIDGDALVALLAEGAQRDDGLSANPRYWAIARWLDQVVRLTSWPGSRPNEAHIFVPGAETSRYVVGASAVYDASNAVSFLAPWDVNIGDLGADGELPQQAEVRLTPYNDRWGWWLSGTAPIRTSGGDIVAVLLMDMQVGRVYELLGDATAPLLIFSAFSVVALIALVAGLVISWLRRRARGSGVDRAPLAA